MTEVPRSRRRLLHDRKQLVATLRDYESGTAGHLACREREALIDKLRERIAEVNRKLHNISTV